MSSAQPQAPFFRKDGVQSEVRLYQITAMEQSHSTDRLLEQHTVRHLVLRLGIPAMFGQFFNILYSIVDRILSAAFREPETSH